MLQFKAMVLNPSCPLKLSVGLLTPQTNLQQTLWGWGPKPGIFKIYPSVYNTQSSMTTLI